jgi:hypothetical protein
MKKETQPEPLPDENQAIVASAHLLIRDKLTGHVLVNKRTN